MGLLEKKKKKLLERVEKSGEEVKAKVEEAKKSAKDANDVLTNAIRKLTSRSEAPLKLDDTKTLTQLEKEQLDGSAKLYITALTQDCPMDCIILRGVDFPKYVQPIKINGRGRIETHLNARPQELKKTVISDAELEKIIEAAYNFWVPVTIPTGFKDSKTGEREYISDAIRATNFIVLQPVVEGTSDPSFEHLIPLVKRGKTLRGLIEKHHEFKDNREDITYRTTADGKKEKVISV